MQDKVVVGSQDDGLRGLTRFSDNEGDIIWPAWRAELKQRVAFEFGKIGNQIIEGEVKEVIDARLCNKYKRSHWRRTLGTCTPRAVPVFRPRKQVLVLWTHCTALVQSN